MEQKILTATENYRELDSYFDENNISSVLLVSGKSLQQLKLGEYFENLKQRKGIDVIKFDRFHPNPFYESVIDGVRTFVKNQCDSIVAVGGGSAIDIAKCIKLYANAEYDIMKESFLDQIIIPNNIKLMGIPTTAGSGSEATKYAVIYYKGEKKSITHECCRPETILLDSSTLTTLPLYQKKATMLDAMCHSIESLWSVNSTEKSRRYSGVALKLILDNMEGYLSNEEDANANMLKAAHIAGKAINITQTTAGHAMCYKLTTMYSIAHGHAAALCVNEIWPWMLENMDRCVEPRGREYLNEIFQELSEIIGCISVENASDKFRKILYELEMEIPNASDKDYEILCKSVNPVRLRNTPVLLDEQGISLLYHRILGRQR